MAVVAAKQGQLAFQKSVPSAMNIDHAPILISNDLIKCKKEDARIDGLLKIIKS